MIRLCSLGIGTSDYSDVFGVSVDPGIAREVIGAAGNYRADFNVVLKQNMMIAASLRDLAAVSAPGYQTGKMIFRKEVEGDVAGSGYVSFTSATNKCMVVPQGISWSSGGMASLSLMMQFLSTNGTTAPVTVGTAAGDLEAVSEVYVGASSCVENINLNFGYTLRPCKDGLLYPHKTFVVSQRPTLTIVTSDESGLDTANIAPGEIATLTASFAKVAEGGVRGATRSYALTGHIQRSVGADGNTTVSVQGKGGFTIS